MVRDGHLLNASRVGLCIHLNDVLDWPGTAEAFIPYRPHIHFQPGLAHPTLVARRSHNTLWHSYAAGRDTWLATYDEKVLEAGGWKLAPMLARRGGGFLLDTNALHREAVPPTPQPGEARLSVVLEFHPHGKIPRLHGEIKGEGVRVGPCPSFRARGGKDNATWMYGVRGYPLYPAEGGM